MKAYNVFKEYIWLVNTIRRAGKITLREINDKWRETDMSGGVNFARATFNRHKDAIEDIFGIISLDRIKHLEIMDVKFKVKKDFDAKEYFDEYFGVTTGDGTELERIAIRAYGEERFYMHDLPWHHTQKEVASCDDYSDFELTLRPTYDFSNRILSAGNRVRVLSPRWLASEVREMHLDAARIYDEE